MLKLLNKNLAININTFERVTVIKVYKVRTSPVPYVILYKKGSNLDPLPVTAYVLNALSGHAVQILLV